MPQPKFTARIVVVQALHAEVKEGPPARIAPTSPRGASNQVTFS